MKQNKIDKLNAAARRKRKERNFWIFAGIFFALCLFTGFVVGSYRASLKNPPDFFLSFAPAFRNLFSNPVKALSLGVDFSNSVCRESICYPLIASVLLILLLYYNDQRHVHDLAGMESGSAKWNDNLKEYNRIYGRHEADKYEPQIFSQRVTLSTDTFVTKRNNNVLCIGGSGTGKSRYEIKPNILQMNGNYVITDPAGELIEATGQVLKDNGYEIKVFDLVDMTKSFQYNPFRYIRDDKGVMMMIHCLIKNTTPPNQHGEKFWEDAETALLLALCFFLRDYCPEEMQNLSTVSELLRWADVDENDADATESKLDRIFLRHKEPKRKQPPKYETKTYEDGRQEKILIPDGDALANDPTLNRIMEKMEVGRDKDNKPIYNFAHKSIQELDKDGTSIAVKQYQVFKLSAGKTAKSILTSCAVRLSAFNLPSVANLTNIDTIHLDELSGITTKTDNAKQALFVIIPAADSTYNFLVSMMYSQLFETLYYIAEKNPKCKHQRLPVPVHFLLDEFANIGTIPEFEKKLSTMRKYDISCFVILQSLSQIKTLYEKEYETIIGNCDTLIFLGGKELTTCEYVSKQLGNQTITSKNRSSNTGGKGGGSSSYQQASRPLLHPDELSSMPNSKCIVMIRGVDPFLDDKYTYEKHPLYEKTGDGNEDNKFVNTQDNTPSAVGLVQTISNNACVVTKAKLEDVVKSKASWADFPNIYVTFKEIHRQTETEKTNQALREAEDVGIDIDSIDNVDSIDNKTPEEIAEMQKRLDKEREVMEWDRQNEEYNRIHGIDELTGEQQADEPETKTDEGETCVQPAVGRSRDASNSGPLSNETSDSTPDACAQTRAQPESEVQPDRKAKEKGGGKPSHSVQTEIELYCPSPLDCDEEN